MKPVLSLILLATALILLSGCNMVRVEPWDRDALAQKKMQLTPDKLESSADEHIYFSKEASSGGQGVGGGGCGCN